VFSAVAADAIQNFGLEANGVTRPVWGYEVSGQYFQVFAIRPALGRRLQRSDDKSPRRFRGCGAFLAGLEGLFRGRS
jgi:hypothetical protein